MAYVCKDLGIGRYVEVEEVREVVSEEAERRKEMVKALVERFQEEV